MCAEPVMTPPIDTLGDALPREMARVRDAVLPTFELRGIEGVLAAEIRRDLDAAAKALAARDAAACLRAFLRLKGWSL